MTCPSVFGIMEAAGQEMIIFCSFQEQYFGAISGALFSTFTSLFTIVLLRSSWVTFR